MSVENIIFQSEKSVNEALSLLKVQQTVLTGLKKLEECFRDEKNGQDAILCYLNISSECNELFAILEESTKVPGHQLKLIWELFEIILLTTSESRGLHGTGITITRKLLLDNAKHIYSALSHSSSQTVKDVTFKLLTAMLTQGPAAVRECLDTFNFSLKSLQGISKIHAGKVEVDVRTSFLQWFLSFLIFGDPKSVRQLLGIKVFGQEVIRSLVSSSAATVTLVLSTLREKVVQQEKMLRKTKIEFFSGYALAELSKLCDYGNAGEETDLDVRKLAFNLLNDLCCDDKMGIGFPTKGDELTKRTNNPVLLRFLLSIKKRAMEEETLMKITMSALDSHRDMILPYVSSLKLVAEPRPSMQWMKSMTFLQKLWSGLPPPGNLLIHKKKHLSEEDMRIFTSFVVPDCVDRRIFTRGLKHPSAMVKLMTLKLISVVAARAIDAKKVLNEDWLGMDASVVTAFENQLNKALPETTLLVGIRQNCASSTAKDTKTSEGSDPKPTEENLELDGSTSSTRRDTLLASLEVLHYYVKIWPTVFLDSGFNPCKLMVFDDMEAFLHDPVLQELTLKVISCLPPKAMRWNDKKESYHLKFFRKILQLFSVTEVENVKELTINLIIKLLQETGMFESHQCEVFVWLSEMGRYSGQEHSEDIVSYFNNLCMNISQDQVMFLDELVEIGAGGTIIPHDRQELRFPFSPIVVASMKTLPKFVGNTESKSKAIKMFICGTLSNLLICHRETTALAGYVLRHVSMSRGKNSGERLEDMQLTSLASYCKEWLEAIGSEVPADCLEGLDNLGKYEKAEEWKDQQVSKRLRTVADYFPLTKKRLKRLVENEDAISEMSTNATSNYVMEIESNAIVTCLLNMLVFASTKRDKVHVEATSIANILISKLQEMIASADSETTESNKIPYPKQKPSDDIFTTIFSREVVRNALLCSSEISESLRGLLIFFLTHNAACKSTPAAMQMFTSMCDWITANLVVDDSDEKHYQFTGIDCYKRFNAYFAEKLKEHIMQEIVGIVGEQSVKEKYPSQILELTLILMEHFFRARSDSLVFFEERPLFIKIKDLLLHPTSGSLSTSPDFQAKIMEFAHPSAMKMIPPDAFLPLPKSLGTYSLPMQRLLRVSSVHRFTIVESILGGNQKELLGRKDGILLIRDLLLSSDSWAYGKRFGDMVLHSCTEMVVAVLDDGADSGDETKKAASQVLESLVTGSFKGEKIGNIMKHLITFRYQSVKYYGYTLPTITSFLNSRKGTAHGEIFKNVLHYILRCWHKAISSDEPEAHAIEKLVRTAVDTFTKIENVQPLLHFKVKGFVSNAEKCIKIVLRKRFIDAATVSTLKDLSDILYCSKEFTKETKIQRSDLYQMVMSHSKFLDVVQGNDVDEDGRETIFTFLHSLIKYCSDECSASHVPLLFTAYGASLTRTDQTILRLLQVYDENDALPDTKLFLWGPSALEFHRNQKEARQTLLSQPSSQDVFELLDARRILESAINFPLNRTLMDPDGFHNAEDTYDPAFLLPLFNNLLDPGVPVDCRKFAYDCCLAFVIGGLSSHVDQVRVLCSHLLMKYQEQLEGSRFKEKNQVECLLKHLKFSVLERGQRVSSCLCNWFIQSLQLLMRPDQHLYPLINGFLLSHCTTDLKDVPLFFPLFNSSTLKFTTERAWMLRLIAGGLRDKSDYHTVTRQHIFPMVMSFHDAPFSDPATRKIVLKILSSACKIHSAAFDLVKEYGLMSWLTSKSYLEVFDQNLPASIIEILEALMQVFDIGGDQDIVYPPNYFYENYLVSFQIARNKGVLESPDLCRRLVKIISKTVSTMPAKNRETTQMSVRELQSVGTLCCAIHKDSGVKITSLEDTSISTLQRLVVSDRLCDTDWQLVTQFLHIFEFFLKQKCSQLQKLSFIDWAGIARMKQAHETHSMETDSLSFEHEKGYCGISDSESIINILGNVLLIVSKFVSSMEVIKSFIPILQTFREMVNVKYFLRFGRDDLRLFTALSELLVKGQSISQYTLNVAPDAIVKREDAKLFFKWLSLIVNVLLDMLHLLNESVDLHPISTEFMAVKTLLNRKEYLKESKKQRFSSHKEYLANVELNDDDEMKKGRAYILLSAWLEDILLKNEKPDRYLFMLSIWDPEISLSEEPVAKKETRKKKRKQLDGTSSKSKKKKIAS